MQTISQLEAKVSLLQRLLALLQLRSKSDVLYQFAFKFLGADASPNDLANDIVGCAESVSTILNRYMGFPIILGTATLYSILENSPKFRRVAEPVAGSIIVSPTGMGNGSIQGHTGIVGRGGQILSNDSYTGKWSTNFTIPSWVKRYHDQGGLPVLYYTLI